MENMMEIIRKRKSIRTYDGMPIESHKLQLLEHYLSETGKGPFGNEVRFRIVDASEAAKEELKKLGAYGNIRGTGIFLAGAVIKGNKANEDFGYCMERAILKATELGIGTCWLGGSLNRSTFGEKMKAAENEVIPAVTPLGYPADKRRLMDRFIRTLSKGDGRKLFGEVFFEEGLDTPLLEEAAGKYGEVLEGVRLAPSASNKQPWRIIKGKDENIFHLYLKENKTYNHAFKDILIQNIDMGIAMCHFELTALGLGLQGTWTLIEQPVAVKDLEYIASWKEK